MIYQNYKKYYARQLFYLSFAAILLTGLLALSDYPVKSQRVPDFKKFPFKFNGIPKPSPPGNLKSVLVPTTAGSLDLTFDFDGKLTTDFSSSETASANAVQADGKIVVAGSVNTGTNFDFAVFRYNADGSLDTSFDGDGKVTTSIDSFDDYAFAVSIQPDGKIVAAGRRDTGISNDFALVRYNADGLLDTSFGIGGKVITAFGGYSAISEIVLQADGKIIAAGFSYNETTYYDFTFARYNSNGSLDSSFGTGGIVTTDFGDEYDESATSVAVQADGKIVAAGYRGFELSTTSFALARYNADGTLDTLFDGDGKVTTDFGGYSAAYTVVIQADGKIVAAGYGQSCYIFNCGNLDFAVVRYNIDGSLDTSFDGDGKVTTDFGASDSAFAVALKPTGKIVVSGRRDGSPTNDFALAQYNSDGSPDTSFDNDGKITTDFGGHDAAYDVAIQADGRIVAAGYSGNYPNYDFALARYNTDGSLDASFDADGKVMTSLLDVTSAAKAVATQLDGMIVVAGFSNNGSNHDFAVARYYPSGGLDYSFGGNGKVTTPIGNFNDFASAVAIQADGKIVVVGLSYNGSTTDFAVVRYNPDGSLDTSFDGDGKVTTPIGSSDEAAYAVALQADGKIVAAGFTISFQVFPFAYEFAVVRYNPDGSLDTSFDEDGKVTTSFGGDLNDFANAVIIQVDGKIIAAGGSDSRFALVRYNTNGSLDTSFDTDGRVTTPIGIDDSANAVAIRPDGKIVAAGVSYGTNTDFAVVRYNPEGSLDTSFDGDGKVTTPIGSSNDQALAVAIQRNGKIVVAGFSHNGSNTDFALVRYNPNGLLDTSFDTDGIVTTQFGSGNEGAEALAIQRDGKIVAAGSANNGTRTDFAVARYIGDEVRTKFDYDGDDRTDISVFRPGNRTWYVVRSSNGVTDFSPLNISSDKIVPADFDGDGKTDIAQFNSATGTWYLLRSQLGYITVRFGASGDLPVPADYDGDGKDDVAVYRPSTGTWWIIRSSDGSFSTQRFGLSEDKPVAGDYDGDGRSDLAVYRPSSGVWYLLQSTAGFGAVQFGLTEDKPIVGDYDGDGKTDIAVYRPSTNVWYVLRSTNGSFFAVPFGLASDIPAPGDYDGDGKTDIAVFRNGVWYILQSSDANVSYRQFGLSGDNPTPSAFIP